MRYGARHQKLPLLAFLLSVLSGALLALGWPPSPGFPLLFVAFVPLLYLHDRLPPGKRGTLTYLAAAGLALLLWNACATRWIYNAYITSGIVINCLNVALFTVPWLLYAVSQPVFNRWQRYGLLVSAWMSLELLHYHWELAFPLLTLGNGLAAAPAVAQWYEYTGVFGGSLWLWGTNVLLYESGRAFFVRRTGRGALPAKIAYALLWVLLPLGVSLGVFSHYQEKGASVEVVAVNPNLDCRKERKTLGAEALVKVHWALTKKHLSNRTRYVLWPENAFNLGWLEELPAHPLVLALRDSLKQYPDARLITGAVLYERHLPADAGPVPVNTQSFEANARKIWYNTYNTAVQLNAGPEVQLRTKIHLVPLEETTVYPPVVNLFRKFIPSLGGMFFSTRAANQHLFQNRETVVPLICYESFFGNTVRNFVGGGGNLLFVILNEGWIDDEQASAQFMQYAALRAIENRRGIVRSSNRGITCFIDQRGRITRAVVDHAATALSGSVRVNRQKTFYTLTGDYLGWMALAGFAGLGAALVVAFARVSLKDHAKKVRVKRAA